VARSIIRRVFPSKNEKFLKDARQTTTRIRQLIAEFQQLSDTELRDKSKQLKSTAQLETAASKHQRMTTDAAFAVASEAIRRTLKIELYDEQFYGGLALIAGKMMEMKTGEGKTFVAALAAIVSSLCGTPTHIVTANTYLAVRDADWVKPAFASLDLTVGCLSTAKSLETRAKAYRCDVVYGTNSEFPFDYLADQTTEHKKNQVQTPLQFVIIDEADALMLDEARTPVVITETIQADVESWKHASQIAAQLQPVTKTGDQDSGDFEIDLENRNLLLTDHGISTIEKLAKIENLYAEESAFFLNQILQSIRAHAILKINVDYVVRDDRIQIIDSVSGRIQAGRRWNGGMHQAVEIKENVTLQAEARPISMVTYQNFFRSYQKLSGMTGTAVVNAEEFKSVYALETVSIPTHAPMIRNDLQDAVYLTMLEKTTAMIEKIQTCTKTQQPVLIGVQSVEQSEMLSQRLTELKIEHRMLNALNHTDEAEIIAQAGKLSAVTLVTNMAGRGTDIKLGGQLATEADRQKICELGGLRVLGYGRGESRRIDDQLRGRAGRQGDVGSSQFFVSLEDTLFEKIDTTALAAVLEKLPKTDGQPIEHPILTYTIRDAQKKSEVNNAEIRRLLVFYDDILDKQRKTIFRLRQQFIDDEKVSVTLLQMLPDTLRHCFELHGAKAHLDASSWDQATIDRELAKYSFEPLNWEAIEKHQLFIEAIIQECAKTFRMHIAQKFSGATAEQMHDILRSVALRVIDSNWKQHLHDAIELRQGIGLRAYAQKSPQTEFRRETDKWIFEMIERLPSQILQNMAKCKITMIENAEEHGSEENSVASEVDSEKKAS
jgi:preprotein translocase subunit SecA